MRPATWLIRERDERPCCTALVRAQDRRTSGRVARPRAGRTVTDEGVMAQQRASVRPWDGSARHFCNFGQTDIIYANMFPNTAICAKNSSFSTPNMSLSFPSPHLSTLPSPSVATSVRGWS